MVPASVLAAVLTHLARAGLAVLLLTASVATQSRALALVGAVVYDGTGAAPLTDATVVVQRGRIAAVGPRELTAIPDGARVVDVEGRYITPGLVDTHVHYSQTGWADGRPDAHDARETHPYEQTIADCEAHPERFHLAFLHSGVTAVFDVGGYPWTRRLGARTETSPRAPHVAATGALLATWIPDILTLPDRSQFVAMPDEPAIERAVRSHKAAGSDAIKVWFIVRRNQSFDELAELVRAAGRAAAKHGLPLVVHATSLKSARVAVEAGARLLVHSVEDRPVDDSFVAAAVKSGVYYCPTLTVRAGYYQLYLRELSDEVKSQLAAVHPSVRERVEITATLPKDSRVSRRALEGRRERSLAIMNANLTRMHRAGVRAVLGTDAGNPLTLHGPSAFVEMEAMHAAGLTPRQVLTASTRHAAEAMGRGGDLGRIAAGFVADLLLLERDPGKSIAALRSITHVCRAGTLHERADLLPR